MTETGGADPAQITGLILAGGAGRRADGKDKGLIEWRGEPLVAHVAKRLGPQCSELIVSCNRNAERYATFGRTMADQLGGFQGPLAGLQSAAEQIHTPLTLVCPCDVPLVPTDLAARLIPAMATSGNAIAFARTPGHEHYCCAVLRTDRLRSLTRFLADGGRAVHAWYAQQGSIAVDFPDGDAFSNINTPE
ncbi:MAG: molybdenum cofactor guanylyltransferase [Halioglobus sp.]|nr:molybdenum cofactor guanylyltransferase [Halioglobus sp.]